ncbi:MAG: DNA cytosine methyltransferase [Candidatus Limnocylindrales bacterium]
MSRKRVSERPTAIDLFAGVGGLSLGLEQAGFDVLTAVDSDPVHALTYHYNFPCTEVLCEDITGLSAGRLLSAAQRAATALGRPWDGEIDCIAGGPSCQGFSVIGARDPTDPRNSLVLEFARLAGEIRPRYVLLENVPGLLSPGHKDVFAGLTRSLCDAGYDLGGTPWTLDAYDFGVPQRRRRVFLVGTRRGLATPGRPARSLHISASEALGDLVSLARYPTGEGVNEIALSDEEAAALSAAASSYVARLRGQHAPEDLSTPRRWEPRFVTCTAGTTHSDSVRSRFAALKPGERESLSKLPRLDPAKPSPTLRAGTGRDHGSHTSVRPVHYASPRVITVREAARLHTFPDWFRFHATRWHALRQIGNSVPPALAQAIGCSVVLALGLNPKRRAPIDLGDPGNLEMSLEKAARALKVPASQLPPPRRPQQAKWPLAAPL